MYYGMRVSLATINELMALDLCQESHSYFTESGNQVIVCESCEYRISDSSIIRFVGAKATHYAIA